MMFLLLIQEAPASPLLPAWASGVVAILTALLTVLGALTALATAVAALLPKTWPFTLWVARRLPSADIKSIVTEAAAKNEALARLHNLTTVAPEEQHVGPPPAPPSVPTYPIEVAQAPPTEPTRSL